MIKLILITNDPVSAQRAELGGVDRIFVDLEIIGKRERQGHLDTHITSHSIGDVGGVKAVLDRAELMVRLNPLYEGSEVEVEQAIGEGADILMLPMFRSAEEVAEFVRLVDSRVKVIPLVETLGAVETITDVVNTPGVSEIYIGLNDLYLAMGMSFIFQPLADGLVDDLVRVIKNAGLRFGFGGIARVGDGVIPGELVLSEHLRLGSSSVILSRTFQKSKDEASASDPGRFLTQEIQNLVSVYAELERRSKKQIDSDYQRFRKMVQNVIDIKANETTG